MKNIFINGFGRIGRLLVRELIERNLVVTFNNLNKYNEKSNNCVETHEIKADIAKSCVNIQDQYQNPKQLFNIIGINDLCSIDAAVFLLQHDSIHHQNQCKISQKSSDEILIEINKTTEVNSGILNENKQFVIKFYSIPTPENLPLENVDILCECTGRYTNKIDCVKFIQNGAKKVLVSAPMNDADATIVYGVNHDIINDDMRVISNASCTTNCLAPIVFALEKEYGIQSAFMSTVHSYTADQRLMDSFHKDLRRSRAAGVNIIPTTTGATKAIEKIFPNLSGKLNGISYRVPTPNVSLIDFTFVSERMLNASEINLILKDSASTYLKGVLNVELLPLVSSDYIGNRYSCIVDESLTSVINENMGHIVAWYDNECGFTNRMIDVMTLL